MPNIEGKFPGGSKERVSKAGNAVRKGNINAEDVHVIDTWRAAHRAVLNTFQAILRNRTRGTDIIVAQRHKRKRTIFEKLNRFPKMQLARMDDVAGCRLIFKSSEELYEFRADLHEAKFNHQLRNEVDKYDYIKRPKSTGYRGVHDVYLYDVNSDHGKSYKGLLIEVQYRTRFQHAWATCVEVVGFITASQPKFQEGDKRYETILALASEIIARAYENRRSCFPELGDAEVVRQFTKLNHELNFMNMLRNLNAANHHIADNKNVILMFSDADKLEVRTFRDATDAMKALFELEKETPGKDIVLVRADTAEEVRIAFRNYFSDATEFIDLVERGCTKLSGVKVLYAKTVKKASKARSRTR